MKNTFIALLLVPAIAMVNGRLLGLETKVLEEVHNIRTQDIAFERASVAFPVSPVTFTEIPGTLPVSTRTTLVSSGTSPVTAVTKLSNPLVSNPCVLTGFISDLDLQPQASPGELIEKFRIARSAQNLNPHKVVAGPSVVTTGAKVATSPCKPGFVLDKDFDCCVIDFSFSTDTSVDLP